MDNSLLLSCFYAPSALTRTPTLRPPWLRPASRPGASFHGRKGVRFAHSFLISRYPFPWQSLFSYLLPNRAVGKGGSCLRNYRSRYLRMESSSDPGYRGNGPPRCPRAWRNLGRRIRLGKGVGRGRFAEPAPDAPSRELARYASARANTASCPPIPQGISTRSAPLDRTSATAGRLPPPLRTQRPPSAPLARSRAP